MLVPRLALALLLVGGLSAQEPERPRAASTRVDSAPKIDGRPDDAAWQGATPIGELQQLEPAVGVPASEATEVRFVHDADHLYMLIRCFDSEPQNILTTTKERDGLLEVDDFVEIVFDTFHDRRNAFFFQINAAGSKGDALITNNGANFNKPWDGIWEGVARVDEHGWCAELALPFKTLNFREGETTWGFNIQRHIGRKREEDRWSNGSRDFSLFNIYRAGELTGLTGIRQGIGLDIVPFFVSHWRNEGGDKTVLGEPGFDLFYKLIPSLTFAWTVNTDFAETEVDSRQINLTRFPLFFPERRDFFLQDAGVFEFGFNNSGGGGGTSLIPFFSRRIGLSPTGEEVPILTGAKLTGRAGDYGIGVLDVQTDDQGSLDGQNLLAARVTKNVGAQSTIGGLVTHGNPADTGDNTVYGLDATNRASIFGGGRELITTGFYLKSESEGISGDDSAFGLDLRAPGDLVGWAVSAMEIQDDFNPALGFVPRAGIRRYDGGVEYQPRPGWSGVRQLEFSVDSEVFTDTSGELETWNTEVQPFGIFFESGDGARIEFDRTHDELFTDFEIADGVIIPTGVYEFSSARLELESAEKRPLSASVALTAGDFYDGQRTSWGLGATWHPSALFLGSAFYELNDVRLEGGDFDTQLAQLRANFSFTPELSWNSFLQWDTESDTIGVQTRLRWIPVPQQEVFLVFNETLESDMPGSSPLSEELSFKVTYAFRF